jgi:hypothetical protein
MSVYFYKSTDAGAPTLNGTAGSLISVLDACLVNGYGSKSAAGWTKEYSGTNLAAYRMSTVSPATGMYLRVDDTGTTNGRIVGYESMSDVNTGTGPFPTSVQVSGGLYVYKSTSSDSVARPWAIIATNRSFYLYDNPTLTNEVLSSATASDNLYFFGDIITRKAVDGYECVIIAMPNTYTSNSINRFGQVNSAAAGYAANNGHYMARAYTGIGGSIQIAKGRNYVFDSPNFTTTLGTTVSSYNAYPDPITQSINFATTCIAESVSVVRGNLPGFYEPISGANMASAWYEYQGQGSMSGKNLVFIPTSSSSQGLSTIQINGSWY